MDRHDHGRAAVDGVDDGDRPEVSELKERGGVLVGRGKPVLNLERAADLFEVEQDGRVAALAGELLLPLPVANVVMFGFNFR